MDQIDKLRNRLAKCREARKKAVGENESLSDKLEDLEDEILRLKAELAEAGNCCGKPPGQCKKEHDELTQKCAEWERRFTNASSDAKRLNTELEGKTKQCVDVASECVRLRQTIEELQARGGADEVEKWKAKWTERQRKCEELESKLREKDDDCSRKNEECEKLRRECGELKAKYGA